MNVKTKRVLIIVVCNLFFIIFAGFCVSGPLAPWMPFVMGYEIRDYGNVSVVSAAGNRNLVPDLNYGKILASVESFHGLQYHRKIRIFFLRDPMDLKRFLPWFPHPGGPSGYELNSGDTLFIDCAAVQRKGESLEEVVKHELSHCIIHQNMGFFDTFALKSWFVEGLAVYSGGPHDYPEDEFNRILAGTTLVSDKAFNDLYLNLPKHNPRFRYALYGKFIGYLARTGGIRKMQKLIKAVIRNPHALTAEFTRVYGVGLGTLSKDFTNDLRKTK